MNLKYWICPNCDQENIDDAVNFKFQCAKCHKTFSYYEINMFDKDDEPDGEYPYDD